MTTVAQIIHAVIEATMLLLIAGAGALLIVAMHHVVQGS
jgi:hypothetical protein